MRRGDVVRTREEFYALPAGSVVVNIEGLSWARSGPGVMDDEWPREPFPALVQVVGPVEPEWLEAAARAGRGAFTNTPWEAVSEDTRDHHRDIARAAVAAADKARGIVNSREEFDALAAEVGIQIVEPLGVGNSRRWWQTTGEVSGADDGGPTHFPCFVIGRLAGG